MSEIVFEKQIQKQKKNFEFLYHAKSDVMTTGGVVIVAVAIVISLVFILSLLFPRGNGLQLVIIIILTLVSWGFLLNCFTEKLAIEDGYLIYKSLMGKTVNIELSKIEAYKLTDLGVRLDGNMFLIELEHSDKDQALEIFLSPCWKKYDLMRFCDTLGTELEIIN